MLVYSIHLVFEPLSHAPAELAMSIVVLASTTLTFIGFLFNFLSVLIPGWGESCVPSSQCTLPSGLQTPNGTVCYMIGLFQYCGAVNGMMTCDTCTCSGCALLCPVCCSASCGFRTSTLARLVSSLIFGR